LFRRWGSVEPTGRGLLAGNPHRPAPGGLLMASLRGVAVGAGYFSPFHYEAWGRIPEIALTGVCDLDAEKTAAAFPGATSYTEYHQMFDVERPDFVDVITPPSAHAAICRAAAERGIHI